MYKIITIGREFGSGGRELGRRLSEKLQIAYYDQEIVTEISKRTSLSEDYVQQIIERRPIMPFPIHTGHSFYPAFNPVFQQTSSVYMEQHKLLREFSEKSDCVIVGRCADYILREKNPFRIFVYADMEWKLKRCLEKEPEEGGVSEQEMKKNISAIDRNRAKYYEFYSGQVWGERKNYNLMVNTTCTAIENTAVAVSRYLERLI